MPQLKFLASNDSAMHSTFSSLNEGERHIRRVDYTNSLRRSVSKMKCLLPLKLSSSLPTSSLNTPTPTQSATFQFIDHRSEIIEPGERHQSPKQRFKVPRPITIRREKYRETPVYTELGSPFLNLAYFTEEEKRFSHSPVDCCDAIPIINGYASSSSGSQDSEELDEETPLPQESPLSKRKRHSRSSDLSFKCLGESGTSCKMLFPDEGAWLSSPLNHWDHPSLPQLLAENMPVESDVETWLSDTSSDFDDGSFVRGVNCHSHELN